MSNKVEATYHSPFDCDHYCCEGAHGCYKEYKCACHREPVDAMPVFIEPPSFEWADDGHDCD